MGKKKSLSEDCRNLKEPWSQFRVKRGQGAHELHIERSRFQVKGLVAPTWKERHAQKKGDLPVSNKNERKKEACMEVMHERRPTYERHNKREKKEETTTK